MMDAQRTQLYHLIDPTDSVVPEMPRERGERAQERGKRDLQTEMAFLRWKLESPEMSGGRDYRRTSIERLPEGGTTMVCFLLVCRLVSFSFPAEKLISKEGLKKSEKNQKKIRKNKKKKTKKSGLK